MKTTNNSIAAQILNSVDSGMIYAENLIDILEGECLSRTPHGSDVHYRLIDQSVVISHIDGTFSVDE